MDNHGFANRMMSMGWPPREERHLSNLRIFFDAVKQLKMACAVKMSYACDLMIGWMCPNLHRMNDTIDHFQRSFYQSHPSPEKQIFFY